MQNKFIEAAATISPQDKGGTPCHYQVEMARGKTQKQLITITIPLQK